MRRRASVLIAPVLGIAATGYCVYHTIEGDHGIGAWVRVNHELHAAQDNLDGVTQRRVALDQKVRDMRPDHVDPDLLDEEVRKNLDMAQPNEIVIIRPKQPAD
ncbi:MAG TPA: septum formation initiator family protein [Stellaceae bacterium]